MLIGFQLIGFQAPVSGRKDCMKTSHAASPGRALRRVPASVVLAVLGLVGLATSVLAVVERWGLAVIGLVLLQLGTVVVVLGPWGVRAGAGAPTASRQPSSSDVGADRQLGDLERRVDALGARLVASTERTRVELLDALRVGTVDVPGDGQR